MSETKFTPGPWSVSLAGAKQFGICSAHSETYVARTWPIEVGSVEANAKLIATAPDMLRALQMLPLSEFNRDGDNADAVDFVDNSGDFIMAMDAARDAIAKATT